MGNMPRTKKAAQHHAKSLPSPSWPQLYAKHFDLLTEHLSVWTTIRNQQLPHSPSYETVQKCYDDTQEMIRNFKQLETSLSMPQESEATQVLFEDPNIHSRKRDSPSSLVAPNGEPVRSNKRQRTDDNSPLSEKMSSSQASKDASNLFMIDTDPTSVEELLAKSKQPNKGKNTKSKRKTPHEEMQPLGADIAIHADAPTENKRKRPKRNSTENKPVGNDATATEDNTSDHEARFIAKVARKHAEKEARRQAKRDKKRKRESDNSLTEHAQGTFKPNKKKKRK